MIIIGNGFIASNIKQVKLRNKSTVFFTSGVSNSKCKDKKEFKREYKKLKQAIIKFPKYRFVYFSSCSVSDKSRSSNDYQKHKLNIEKYIKKNTKNYKIFRLPEVIGKSKNKNTLLNFFFINIKKNKNITTSYNAYRNLIDMRKIVTVVEFILNNNYKKRTIEIVNLNSYSTIHIINSFEKIFKRKINYSITTQYQNQDVFKININYISKIYKKLKIKFNKNYLYLELKKIYGNLN